MTFGPPKLEPILEEARLLPQEKQESLPLLVRPEHVNISGPQVKQGLKLGTITSPAHVQTLSLGLFMGREPVVQLKKQSEEW